MEYTSVKFNCEPYFEGAHDILTAWLSELPFESFESEEEVLTAYIPTESFNIESLTEQISNIEAFAVRFSFEAIPEQNWNKVWEENYFKPIVIAGKCLVRGSFHEVHETAEHEIVIDPKMAFGSGHHATTKMMLEFVLELDLTHKSVLDMGCGTGILAILAAKRGVQNVDAIDFDPWSFENTQENAVSNGTPWVNAILGGAEAIPEKRYDVILANINRNVLLADMEHYVKALANNGFLVLSGFYENDSELIIAKAKALGLHEVSRKLNDDWCAICFN